MKLKDRQKVPLALLLIVIFIGFFLAYATSFQGRKSLEILASKGAVKLNVEIVATPEEWSKGLMFRSQLHENSGMFFAFTDEQKRTFWMKNTLIPLDIIFVSSDFIVVDIKENFQPCKADPCPTYTSKYPAKYVLEVNAGFVGRNGIREGDKIIFPL